MQFEITTMNSNRDNKLKPLFRNEYSTIRPSGIRECLRTEDIPADNRSRTRVLETINSYYGYLNSAEEDHADPAIPGCFAVRLAHSLINAIAGKRCDLTAQGRFKNGFFRYCVQMAHESGLAEEIDDDELLIIYIKQCLHLLKASGIVRRVKGLATITETTLSSRTLFYRLFNAFWDRVNWEDIFPSDAGSARELKTCRSLLKDLVLRHYGAVSVNDIANEFFDMTGFSARNDLLATSFLDFYFFTWLSHFGIVRYSRGREFQPVRITVTEAGRACLGPI